MTRQQLFAGFSNVDDLLNRILDTGFDLVDRSPFDVPWKGEQLVLRKVPVSRPAKAWSGTWGVSSP